MTLIIALACADGVVLASDSQATTGSAGGPIRIITEKIKPRGKQSLWAASGTIGIIQKIESIFDSLPQELRHSSLNEPQFRQLILQNVHDVRAQELDRHRRLYGGGKDDYADVADILVVEYNSSPIIWHINQDASDDFLQDFGYGTSGSGDVFAYTLLKNYKVKELSIDKGSLLAYRVLRDSIDVGAYGLGHPIDIWTISDDGVKRKSIVEINALRDSYSTWLEVEEEMFKRIPVIMGTNE